MERFKILINNRLYITVFSILFLFSLRGWAQSVTVDASIDSLQRFIGQQARIKLEVSCDAGKKVQLPFFADTLVTGIEIVSASQPDTTYLNNSERILLSQEYVVTSFDSASYYIPPFEVMVDGVPHRSQSLAMMVYPMQIDEENPEAIFGHKGIMQISLTWEDWTPLLWKFPLIVVFLIAMLYLLLRYRDNKPIIRKVKVKPKLPPHEQAMMEIARIKEEKSWQKGDPKEYYTELTDVVRIYIHERFGFNAMEKTSAEIIDYLQESKDKEAIEDLRQLFMTADLVKFAKYAPMLNENDMNLVTAIEFINRTKMEPDPDAKPLPTEITIEEKRSRRTKIALIAGVVLLSVAVLFLLYQVGTDLYNLFF